jgi:hypothetical protein
MDKGTIFLLGIIVIAIIAVPSLIRAGENFSSSLADWVKNGFGGVATTGQNSTGDVTTDLIISYMDGTNKTFKNEGLSLFPLTIYDNTANVSFVSYAVNLHLSFSSDVKDVQVVLRDRLWLWKSSTSGDHPDAHIGDFIDKTYGAKTFTEWISGETKNIARNTFTAQELESFVRSKSTESGYNFAISWNPKLDVTAHFKDGNTDVQSTRDQQVARWNFGISASHITSMDIQLNKANIYS